MSDDGYRLTYGGLDYLALHTHLKRQTLYSTGTQIGTGKESDIHAVADSNGLQLALKIHRLGRISFRSVKTNRDYLRHRSAASWLYMSRLAALKEFAFLTALHENGFRVPKPVSQNRHTLIMELVQALPLRQIKEVPDPAGLYAELMETILRLARFGLIHGDFNEFNILILEDQSPPTAPDAPPAIKATPVIIDFPQMVSIDHENAEFYFDRDVSCIKRFFERRFHFVSEEPGPFFMDARKQAKRKGHKRLDIDVEASGFSRRMAKELEKYMREVGAIGDGEGVGSGDEESFESDSNDLDNDDGDDDNGGDNGDVISEKEELFGDHPEDEQIPANAPISSNIERACFKNVSPLVQADLSKISIH